MSGSNLPIETVQHNMQLDENLQQHRKGWTIQRIGWGLLYGGLVLAMAGLFGTGPLSQRTASQDGNVLTYERFLRYEAEAEMSFHIRNTDDTITLEVPQQYLEFIEVKAITPLPARNRMTDGTVIYYFPAHGNATIHCALMARKSGNIHATIMANETAFPIAHLIYP